MMLPVNMESNMRHEAPSYHIGSRFRDTDQGLQLLEGRLFELPAIENFKFGLHSTNIKSEVNAVPVVVVIKERWRFI
jgi:hypothetical protein